MNSLPSLMFLLVTLWCGANGTIREAQLQHSKYIIYDICDSSGKRVKFLSELHVVEYFRSLNYMLIGEHRKIQAGEPVIVQEYEKK